MNQLLQSVSYNRQLVSMPPFGVDGQTKPSRTGSYSSNATDCEGNLVFRHQSRQAGLERQRLLTLSWLRQCIHLDRVKDLVSTPKAVSSKTDELKCACKTQTYKSELTKAEICNTDSSIDAIIEEFTMSNPSNRADLLESLQKKLEMCSEKGIQSIISFVKDRLEKTLDTKLGSFLIRSLINRSDHFLGYLEAYFLQHLKRLSAKDYPCRVMRAVLRRSESLRQLTLRKFAEDFDFCLKNFPSIFLLTEAIRFTKVQKEFSFIIDAFQFNPQKLLNSRYFKRILVTLVEFSSDEQLRKVETCLESEKWIARHLNDKFTTMVLILLLHRQSFSSTFALNLHSQMNPSRLMKARFFCHYIIAVSKVAPRDVRHQLDDTLSNLRQSAVECTLAGEQAANSHPQAIFVEYCCLLISRQRRDSQQVRQSLRRVDALAFDL